MRWWQSPALHMLAIGGAMFGLSALRGGAADEERPRVVIPEHRLELALRGFATDHRRAPTVEERAGVLDRLIDEEVLYQYALALGMYENPAAQRRLAQIAEFVEANPHETGSEAARAAVAMELGLHHGDLVVRRILVDGARRLIRAVVLLREPSVQSLETYLATYPDEFRLPARVRISQILVNSFRWPDTETRARQLLEQIQTHDLDVEAALALGQQSFVPESPPALTEQALETKFGFDFATEVSALPVGGWAGPIASRYGHHLVYVHERHEATVPPLSEIGERVARRVLHKLADEWLALRLQELRMEFEIVTPERVS